MHQENFPFACRIDIRQKYIITTEKIKRVKALLHHLKIHMTKIAWKDAHENNKRKNQMHINQRNHTARKIIQKAKSNLEENFRIAVYFFFMWEKDLIESSSFERTYFLRNYVNS